MQETPDWLVRDVGVPSEDIRHLAKPTDAIPDRREFKYLIPREELPELRDFISRVCRRDANAGPDGSYRLRSLYLDTWNMRLFKANEREAPVRFKARVRCYPDAPADSPVFAEIKGRNGDVIRKTRAKLPRDRWQALLRGEHAGPHRSDALDDFVYRMHRFDLRPVCHVDYRREAWMSRLEEYARVSIDTRIETRQARDFTLRSGTSMKPVDSPLPTHTRGSISVVELKWADAAPRWMVQLVERFELLRHSFSKYGFSVLALNEDHFADYRRTQAAWA